MKPRVYIETTIPSFYFETRSAPDMVARREWTRQWWNEDRASYELVTSEVVLDELRAGQHPHKASALALMRSRSLPSMGSTSTRSMRGTSPWKSNISRKTSGPRRPVERRPYRKRRNERTRPPAQARALKYGQSNSGLTPIRPTWSVQPFRNRRAEP
jgi:hypothetical protein